MSKRTITLGWCQLGGENGVKRVGNIGKAILRKLDTVVPARHRQTGAVKTGRARNAAFFAASPVAARVGKPGQSQRRTAV